MVNRRTRPPLERATAMIDASGPCWLWTGHVKLNGYGEFWMGPEQRMQKAHRAIWSLLVGPIPNGHELDHLCRVRHCVNPDHLQPVTHQTNVDRGSRSRGVLLKTHCVRGHEYTPENTKRQRGGNRTCRTCAILAAREWRARRAAA